MMNYPISQRSAAAAGTSPDLHGDEGDMGRGRHRTRKTWDKGDHLSPSLSCQTHGAWRWRRGQPRPPRKPKSPQKFQVNTLFPFLLSHTAHLCFKTEQKAFILTAVGQKAGMGLTETGCCPRPSRHREHEQKGRP